MHHPLFRISSINSKEVVCFLFFLGGEVNVRRQITFFVGKGFWERLEKNVRKPQNTGSFKVDWITSAIR